MKTIKLTYSLIAIVLFIVLYNCKREITNPFDIDCPKELFTPSDLKAELQGSAVKLSWKQTNTQISGFVISRNESDGAMDEVAKVDKSITSWSDDKIVGGKKYGYQIIAYAGENLSNAQKVTITPVTGAVVMTAPTATELTPFSAVLGGNVIGDGGATVTERGICYGTNQNPTISGSKLAMGTGIGEFSNTIAGLTANNGYFARAYAINSQGTTYGNQITFTTSVPLLTVSPLIYDVSKEAGSRVFTVNSNIDWQVKSDKTWCILNVANGKGNGTVIANYDANTAVGQRSAALTFSGVGVSNQIAVITQAGTEPPVLTITPANQNVTNIAGSTTFTISSNVSWTAKSDQTWCTVSNTSGTGNATLTINYEANTTNSQRIATLSVTGLGISDKTITITQQPPFPTAGLLAYYPFNGNAKDESGNGNNGTVNGATLSNDRFNKARSAYSFDGINDYISLGQNSILRPSKEISISVWTKIKELKNEHGGGIFHNCVDANEVESGYRIDTYSNSCNWWVQTINGKTDDYTYGQAYFPADLNIWIHIVGTFDGRTGKLYFNGVEKSKFEKSGNINWVNSPLDARIGMSYPTEYFIQYFNGLIDDIRIYNRALTESEIQQLFIEQ